ncbi:MAG: peptide ABC transporter substrate-binding protein [Treponema sp.]|jgi:peptide/nickel transport system substrate-binding protein/oligopeptide transport system substrate-binding protein|nr:peptide ABC transporter substrate-binding protein [Treponema sp.]
MKIKIAAAWIIICIAGFAGCKATPHEANEPLSQADSIPGEDNLPGESPIPEDGPEYAETRPRASIRDVLTVVFSKGEVELDFRKSYIASDAQIFTALYEGLFSYNPLTMEPVSALASRWELSEDGKQWTFTIRNNARYWNGDPVRAEDFRVAWLSVLEPGRDSPYSSLFDIIEGAREYRLGTLRDQNRVGISAPNDRTLVVRLNSPASFFPSMLCHHTFAPVHPSMANKADWSVGIPVSNGPFYIKEMNEDRMTLVKNDYYWDVSNTSLNSIIIEFTEDGDVAADLWNSGQAHWISGNVNYDALRDRSGITVNAMFATYYYYIRSARRPWADHRLRRALSLVLPWDSIREGHFLPATTLVYPISGYPEIKGVDTTDVEEARRLLEEAGYARGVGLPTLVIRITPDPEAARISRLMAAAWMEMLGIPSRVEVVSYGSYLQSLKRNDYDIGYSIWIGDFADPYTFLQMWRRDSNLNDAQYNDPDYEALLEKSMTEEGRRRWQTLAEAEELLLSRGTVLPISYNPAVNVVDTDEIEGWFPNALDIHPFKYLAFRSFRPLPGVAMAAYSVVH